MSNGYYTNQLEMRYWGNSPEITRTATVASVEVKNVAAPQRLALDYSLLLPIIAGTLLVVIAKRS